VKQGGLLALAAAFLPLPAASASAAQASGDFDGDGKTDLAVDVENQNIGGQPGVGARRPRTRPLVAESRRDIFSKFRKSWGLISRYLRTSPARGPIAHS